MSEPDHDPGARAALLALLSAHAPRVADDKERDDLVTMLRLARELERPFSREERRAHFTGSAVVVDRADGAAGRVLLVHHGKLHRWLQPGGHGEPGDGGDLARTALREATEETGLGVAFHPAAGPTPIDVDVHGIPARGDEPAHLHLDVRYLLHAHAPERLRHDPAESHGARWLGWDEALAVADEAPLGRLLAKARALCHGGAAR